MPCHIPSCRTSPRRRIFLGRVPLRIGPDWYCGSRLNDDHAHHDGQMSCHIPSCRTSPRRRIFLGRVSSRVGRHWYCGSRLNDDHVHHGRQMPCHIPSRRIFPRTRKLSDRVTSYDACSRKPDETTGRKPRKSLPGYEGRETSSDLGAY